MKRPRTVWLIFGVCLAIVATGLLRLSALIVGLENTERELRQQSAFEESIRVALWRMDSAVAPIIAEENSRPYYSYRAFYDGKQPYRSMFVPPEYPDVALLTPSPLLTAPRDIIKLHFQIEPDGAVSSPQCPSEPFYDAAVPAIVPAEKVTQDKQVLESLGVAGKRRKLLASCVDFAPGKDAIAPGAPDSPWTSMPVQTKMNQKQRASRDWQMRVWSARTVALSQKLGVELPDAVRLGEGVISASWIDGDLLLLRKTIVDDNTYVQGAVIDWPSLERRLISGVRELLPQATLRPAERTEDPIHLLAGIPVQLVPGSPPPLAAAGLSPIRLSMITVWACLALWTVAAIVLLRAMIALSERRAAFVSAVTHELRTPLTTFQMYTEMLSSGMITEAEKQAEYFQTMHEEAGRLSHLVENVLAYSRLDQGRADCRLATVSVSGLIELAKSRLEQRVREAKRGIHFSFADSAADAQVHTDVSVVEQILFNLVDNACKYGENTVEVSVAKEDGGIALRVRDRGPGIAAAFRHKLFQPFSKSDREAANSAPGVGLGLSLCRGLARSIGGDLVYDSSVSEGACFVLNLPAA